MKHKTFISLIALLLLASISFIGCNDDGVGAAILNWLY
jgi:predicted small secreted protein